MPNKSNSFSNDSKPNKDNNKDSEHDIFIDASNWCNYSNINTTYKNCILGQNSFEKVVNCNLRLMSNEQALNDDMLILCFEYCLLSKNNKLAEKFIDGLKSLVKNCLESKAKGKNSDLKYLYFKKYLLTSNIWLEQYKNKLLYYSILKDVANKKLINGQKKYIFNKIQELRKTNAKMLSLLSKFGDHDDTKKVRQDMIEYGVKSDNNWDKSDLLNEFNSNVYLNTLLAAGHELNNRFQSDMKKLFANRNDGCTFEAGVVKTQQRCRIKATDDDYKRQKLPIYACILDIIRCSITCDSIEKLLNTMRYFITKVNGKQSGCIKQIVRIKNGFKNVQQFTMTRDCHYCDVKVESSSSLFANCSS